MASSSTEAGTVPKLSNFIGGEFVAPQNGSYFENVNPTNQEVISLIPDSGQKDADLAVAAAKKAFDSWRKTPLKERAAFCKKVAEIIRRDMDSLLVAECRDTGKSKHITQLMDCEDWHGFFDGIADFALVHSTNYFQMEDAMCVEHRDSIGVCALITPWNFPLFVAANKVSTAIVMGNTCVLKPSEMSPTTASMLCSILNEAGVPPGVVNVIHGYGPRAGEPLVCHRHVRAVSFTGGTETGARVAQLAAAGLKKTHLELGGKNAAIVFGDCDLEDTVSELALASFGNTGQICTAASRHFVHSSIYDKYVAALVKVANEQFAAKTGHPLDDATVNGPLISLEHRRKVEDCVESAIAEGGHIECGGKRPQFAEGSPLNKGAFLLPTVVTGVSHSARCAKEEIFGPVVTVHKFDGEAEAILKANSVELGLCASVWTTDARIGQRVARQLEAGVVWVNCWEHSDFRQGFGGVKKSGIGKENGRFGIDFFSQIKPIVFKM